METKEFKIESAKSRIDWIGKKVTGAHNGTIEVKEGSFTLNDGRITEGKVIIDMSSIMILDVTDAATNTQFAGHLASDDFFSIEKFPEASFEIVSVNAISGNQYHFEGNLTIKGITHAAAFDATVESSAATLNLVGKLIVDRTKYGIKFRSGNFFRDLGDTLIYNDFELDVNVTANLKN
ncbi:YceI family protein [Flavobacterium wongokense]|uniref:YceI family protein n=1 Tax=Flavobacterium wongokense TaxID=2910674 RepID=UPI001F40F519|nr:YceI family protein [Flavobacterium sp. WG47]MCF6132908.1 YceI family protein [Flavobacterium sp. WG47]